MARNLARSSRGTLSSSARSSRREPKSRRDCSRLVNRWYPKASTCWMVGGVGRSTVSVGGVISEGSAVMASPAILLGTTTIRRVQSRTRHVRFPRYEVGPKPKRRTELGLLVFGGVLTVALYVIAELGAKSKIPPHIGPLLGIVLGLSLVAHMANRWLIPQANAVNLPLATLLNGIGYVVIVRWNPPEAKSQAGWAAIGIGPYIVTL